MTDNDAGIEAWIKLRDNDRATFDKRLDAMPPRTRAHVLDRVQLADDLAEARKPRTRGRALLPDDPRTAA